MTYDPNFDQFRLDQLASQFLSGSSVQGKVIFFSESDDNRLDVSTWRLEEEDYAEFKKSGFWMYLMELLDALLVYRARHNQPNASQGVVHIDRGLLHLEWVSKEQVESLRSAETVD